MANNKKSVLTLMKSRLSLAEAFSLNWRKDVKKWLKDYEIDSLDDIDFPDLHNKMQIPYIFSTVESALPSMFERVPDVTILQRGKLDRETTEFAEQIWDYVKERMKLQEKIEEVGMMFLITGMGNLKWGWNLVTEEIDGEPEIVPITNDDGTVIDQQKIISKVKIPVKDEPYVRWHDYDKIHFSPESRFVMDDDENDIPYIICESVKTKDEVEYEYEMTPTDEDIEKIDLEKFGSDANLDKRRLTRADQERVHVYEYYGTLPKDYSKDENWRPDKVYYVPFIKSTARKPREEEKKPINIIGNYGAFNKFWKFGEPKILRELEQDISLGRSRMADIRDKYGQKIAIPQGTEVDERALKRPADFTILRYIGNTVPTYLNPPPMPETIMVALQQSRSDIQMASAQLDLSRGGSSSVVNTATGQQIFAEATEKRIDRKRRKLATMIKHLAKNILKLCADNWDVKRFAQITDMTEEEAAPLVENLKRIGEDYDVRIEIESINNNKETQSAQAIALYDKTKDDPGVNSQEVLKEVLKIGFNQRDYDRFLNQVVTPEQAMMALEYFVTNGIMDEQTAGSLAAGLGQMIAAQQQEGGGGQMGRPTDNPVGALSNSFEGSDNMQITSQNAAAGKQANQPRL